MYQDVKFIKGVLYYEELDGKWYPVRLPIGFAGGGGRGRKGDPGAVGPPGPAGGAGNIESGTFIRTAAEGSGVQVIPTVGQAKLIFFNARDEAQHFLGSEGKSDGVIDNQISQNTPDFDQINSIRVFDSNTGNEMTGRVTAINPTSFEITWTKVLDGMDVRVQWHAITQ